MATEDRPQGVNSRLARPMAWLAGWVLRFPLLTILAAVVLAALGVYISVAKLGYRTSRLDLLNPGHEFNQIWMDYLQEFGEPDDAVVVVEGAKRDAVIAAVNELGGKLERETRLFSAVLHKVDTEKLRAKGLYKLPSAELRQIDGFLQLAEPIAQGQWALLQASNLIGATLQPLLQNPGEQQLGQLTLTLAALNASLRGDGNYVSPWPSFPCEAAANDTAQHEYLFSADGKFAFILLRLAPGKDPFAPGTEATDAVRERIAQVQAKHKQVKLGLTGLPIMENDEMRASQESMTWATILSLAGVALILIAAFGGLRHALLANLVLVIAMCWSFGYATLVVGHLNILSVVFTVTLNGLGIDYGLYYAARYMQKREQGLDTAEALRQAIWEVGPAITIGASTTAAGFFAAVFTTFTGIAELGIIAGGGILLCLVAQLYVLPAFILIVDRGKLGEKMPQPLQVTGWVNLLMKSPRQVVGFTLAISLMIGAGVTQLRYDHNLLNLQAKGLESVELEKRLLSECQESMWFALSVANSPEELLARKARFEKLPTVERCQEIVSLLPDGVAEKSPVIERIHRRVANLPQMAPLISVDQPATLTQVLAQVQQLTQRMPGGEACAREAQALAEQIRTLPVAECYAKLSGFQQRTAGELLTRLQKLATVAEPTPPMLADLPEPITKRFVGQTGKHLLRIYGRGNIWDMDSLRQFVSEVRSIDALATGNPIQAYESSREMKHSYELAVLYSLGVIVAIIAIDLRSLLWTVVALLPLGLGVLVMLGAMGLMNMPLNAANMIALPLILGVGVDYGLHVIYDYRQQGRYQISPSTVLAVMIDALTSSVGFGSMMIANHQGLQSLGRVLTIGTTSCLCFAVFFLPALLGWLHRRETQAAAETSAEPVAEPQPSEREIPPAPAVPVARPTDMADLPAAA